jgi:RNA polymerase sigma-70 factor (ECF subfamily)
MPFDPQLVPSLAASGASQAGFWDDRALFSGLREGRPSALADIMRLYWSPLVDYASTILSSRDAAEDVAQDVFVRLWERRTAWKTSASLRALLYRITRNLALDERRKGKTRARWSERLRAMVRPEVAFPQTMVAEGDFVSRIDRAIEALPPRRREVFMLARFQNLSYKEIAEVMGISPQTVANQMTSALSDLRVAFADCLEDPG